MVDIQVGDQVQARLRGVDGAGREEWLVTEFVVASIDAAGVVRGSLTLPSGIDPAQGWTFDLISRPLTLPTVATEIVASIDSTSGPVSLIGKGSIWVRSDTGALVDPGTITDFIEAELVATPVSLPPIPATQAGQ